MNNEELKREVANIIREVAALAEEYAEKIISIIRKQIKEELEEQYHDISSQAVIVENKEWHEYWKERGV